MKISDNSQKRGQNQTLARITNQKLAMELFKTSNHSASEIASVLGLSNSGTKNIVDELAASGIIAVCASERQQQTGRSPITYSLNAKFGLIAFLDFVDKTITVADICGNKISREKMPSDERYYDRDIQSIKDSLSGFLSDKKIKSPLLAICITVFGKVNIQTSEISQSYLLGNCTLKLKQFFEEHFSVPVTVNTDVHLAMIAERKYGCLKNADEPCAYINVGENVSAAFSLGGELYSGKNGISGAIGLNLTNFDRPGDYLAAQINTKELVREVTRRIRKAQKSEMTPMFKKNSTITFDQLVAAYKNGDELAAEVVDKSARLLGLALKNINDVMDLSVIALNGLQTQFGDSYFDSVTKYLARYSLSMPLIIKARLGEEASFYGALDVARDVVFGILIERLRNEYKGKEKKKKRKTKKRAKTTESAKSTKSTKNIKEKSHSTQK